jgi:hypothetical protein
LLLQVLAQPRVVLLLLAAVEARVQVVFTQLPIWVKLAVAEVVLEAMVVLARLLGVLEYLVKVILVGQLTRLQVALLGVAAAAVLVR